jgi:hypothetical protein
MGEESEVQQEPSAHWVITPYNIKAKQARETSVRIEATKTEL